ncbi:MAG: hypothetical protein ACRDDX_05225, partial [Cellulosilyticaceae bacterium]
EQVILDMKDMRMDYVFLMEDDTYTHFEFQSTDKGILDLVRFNLYDVLLYQQTKKQVYTYVIYSGDIKDPLTSYTNGFNEYRVRAICLAERDANTVLNDIENKLLENKELTDQEQLDLIFTPLMGGELSKEAKIIKAIKLSKDYPMSKKADVQAMLYTFAHKFLSGIELENVKEVMKMTELGKMLHDEGVQEGIQKGIEKGIQKGIEEGKEDMVKELLKEGLLSKEQIAKAAKLPLEKIETIEKSIAVLH